MSCIDRVKNHFSLWEGHLAHNEEKTYSMGLLQTG
jgi:hypothetical protein